MISFENMVSSWVTKPAGLELEKKQTVVKVLVLVLSADSAPYPDIEREIWRPNVQQAATDSRCEILFLRGNPARIPSPSDWGVLNSLENNWSRIYRLSRRRNTAMKRLIYWLAFKGGGLLEKQFGAPTIRLEAAQRVLRTNFPENLMLAGWKTQIGLEWALHQGFTHVFRTNSSSFVDLTKLANLVESLPSHGQALGFQGKMFGYSFLSGAGYLLSRDVVADIVANRHRWNHSLLDDVALSELIIEASSVAFGKLPRLDVDSIAKLDAINVAALRAHFHFRLKTNGHASTVALARAFLQRYQQAN